MVIVELSMRGATVQPLDYASNKQKDLAVFIRKVETVLALYAAVYPMERDQILFAKQYSDGDAAAVCEQFCAAYPEADRTWAAMKELLYSQMALTKHCTDAAF
jgi:hypothetical protein